MWMIEFFAGVHLVTKGVKKPGRTLTPRINADVGEWSSPRAFVDQVGEMCGAVVAEVHAKMQHVAQTAGDKEFLPFTAEPFIYFVFGGRPLTFRSWTPTSFIDPRADLEAGLEGGHLLVLRKRFGALLGELHEEIRKAGGLQFMCPTIRNDGMGIPVPVTNLPRAVSVPFATHPTALYMKPRDKHEDQTGDPAGVPAGEPGGGAEQPAAPGPAAPGPAAPVA